MLGRQLDLLPGHRLQQLAQLRRVADPAAVERVEDQPLGAFAQPDQEMPGKGQPDAVPALRPRGMQIEDAERHRQAFAAVDDPHQIGVLQIVVGQLVAAIAVFQQDDLVERLRPRGEIAAALGMPADIAGQIAARCWR